LFFWFVFWQVPKNEQSTYKKLSLSVDEHTDAHSRSLTLFSLEAEGPKKKALQKRKAVLWASAAHACGSFLKKAPPKTFLRRAVLPHKKHSRRGGDFTGILAKEREV
jgi:hypothetical protein